MYHTGCRILALGERLYVGHIETFLLSLHIFYKSKAILKLNLTLKRELYWEYLYWNK